MQQFLLPTEKKLDELTLQLYPKLLIPGNVIFLFGDLGVGKTTFVRALLKRAGYEGKVKSPSYSLLESYSIYKLEIFHFDFYRIKNENELINLGLEEYFNEKNICLIEWPQMAINILPQANIKIYFEFAEVGRKISVSSSSKN